MLGKLQRIYWKFSGWLFLKHPKAFEIVKKLVPKSAKFIIKKSLARDLSRLRKKTVHLKPPKSKLKVDVCLIGPSTKNDNIEKFQTAGTLIQKVFHVDVLSEAFERVSASKSEYTLILNSEDEIDKTLLEKSLIYLESRLDKGFVIFNGAHQGFFFSRFSLSSFNLNSLERSLLRNSFFSPQKIELLQKNERGTFFIKFLSFGKVFEEKLFEGEYKNSLERIMCSNGMELGADSLEAIKTLREYMRFTKKNHKYIQLSDDPFSRLKNIKIPKCGKPRILFITPWTVVGGSDKVLLDLLKKIKERSMFETIVVTTFDVSTHVGDNVWEDDFKECADYFYPGYDFTMYEDRTKLVKYIANKYSPALAIVSNSGHGYQFLEDFEIPAIDIHHGELFMKHSAGIQSRIGRHIAVSDFVGNLLMEKYEIQKNKIAIIPNGVDEESFSRKNYTEKYIKIKRKLLGVSNEIVLLYIGRLAPEKNPLLTLKILKGLIEEGKRAKLIVVGDGPEREKMVSYIGKNKLEKYVLLEGFKNNTADYLAISDVLILPSYKEAFGIVAIEALMMGIPVVASNIGELPKIIKEGENGFLADPNNFDDFYLKVKLVEESMAELKKNARRTVVDKYSLSKTAKMYEKEFLKVIKGKE